MRRSLGNLGLATLLSVVGSALLINWVLTDNTAKSLLVQTSASQPNSKINQLDIEFKDNSILLNVKLNNPMSCKEVFTTLNIIELPLKDKVYSPICTTVKPELVVVTYKEKRMV
jgi:hypothetical protein